MRSENRRAEGILGRLYSRSGRLLTALVGLFICAATPALATGPADGLYFMLRNWGGYLELDAYYFKAGHVVRSPVGDIAKLDLARLQSALPGYVGDVTMNGSTMVVHWANGTSRQSRLETKPGDKCFAWDAATFCPVSGFKPGERLNGKYEGGRVIGGKGKLLEITFSKDGTYHWHVLNTQSWNSYVKAYGIERETLHTTTEADYEGQYVLDDKVIVLRDKTRGEIHILTFPFDIADNPATKPDHVYFGGAMLQRVH
jgi:hypothetical protein